MKGLGIQDIISLSPMSFEQTALNAMLSEGCADRALSKGLPQTEMILWT